MVKWLRFTVAPRSATTGRSPHAPTGQRKHHYANHQIRSNTPTLNTNGSAAAAFGGYKGSGIGRENHAMMLDHYQQIKNLLVSYSPKALGFS